MIKNSSLDRKINYVIAAISINDDRQNRFKAVFSNILEFNYDWCDHNVENVKMLQLLSQNHCNIDFLADIAVI